MHIIIALNSRNQNIVCILITDGRKVFIHQRVVFCELNLNKLYNAFGQCVNF